MDSEKKAYCIGLEYVVNKRLSVCEESILEEIEVSVIWVKENRESVVHLEVN